jgi:hypothetical protein
MNNFRREKIKKKRERIDALFNPLEINYIDRDVRCRSIN